MMAVFDGVRYSLSPSLSPTRRNELTAILDLNGAASHSPYTHLVALPASHAHATTDPALKLVTDRWVDRSVVMGKRQPEQYYSPDPAMIFSGIVACATDLSAPDLEVLSAGITALGGQWRIGLTRDVTHLFALRAGSDKYNTAIHFAPQTHMIILTPHWFDDAVRLGRRIPETPYTWPDPAVLRPGLTLDLDKDPLSGEGRRKRKPAEDAESADGPNPGEQVYVWDARRILLSPSLELSNGSRRAIEAGIQRAGGVVVPIPEDSDEDAEEKAVSECDVLVTRWRSGKAYFKAARTALLIGTLNWLFSVESSGTLHSPLDSLLWYPTPTGGIPELVDSEISITNYTGAARDYLKRLIILAGAKFTPSMSQSNKVLIAGFQPSPKTTRALTWSIPVVNHTWLEDCFVDWRAHTVGLERYILYPPGIDFGKLLMTYHDGPLSSQSSLPRSNGGAVPGGRGVGIVNVEQEEARDAEYRARTRESGEGISAAQLNGDVPESRRRPHSRPPLVKKTPASMRMKRGSISTPTTASATGAFIDHVIELPSDDGEVNTGGKQRTPAHAKQRAIPASGGSRPASRNVSGPSPVGPSSAEKKVEVVMPDLAGKDKGKGKRTGNTSKDSGSRLPRPVHDTSEDEDAPQSASAPKSKSKPRLVQRNSDVHMDNENEIEKRVVAQSSKPRRPVGRLLVGSESDDAHSDGRARSVDSVPPWRTAGAPSATPVMSAMKPRQRSKSRSGGSVLGVESGDEGPASPTAKPREESTKLIRKGNGATKDKEKEKEAGKGKEKNTTRLRSPTRSPLPTSPEPKSGRTPKRRMSILVPSVSKDYFSSQDSRAAVEQNVDENDREQHSGAPSESRGKQPVPMASMSMVAAEASISVRKRGRPSKTKAQPKAKPRPSTSKQTKARSDDEDDVEMNEAEEVGDTSMIVDEPAVSTSRAGPRRGAASKATTRLRDVVMPDLVSFEKEQKLAKRRRSGGGESVASLRDEDEGEGRAEKGRRKVATEEREEEEEAQVESVVLVPSVKKRKLGNGKAKASTVDSEEEMDEVPVKNKGARGQQKELAAVRLLTTGVKISDDVIKRLGKLGVQMTMKPMDCTHLVAKGIVRTEKFLCAMSVSPYILTEAWAIASAKAGKLLNETEYLLTDAAAEQRWAFNFSDAMARAKGSEGGLNLFKHMTFYVTPKVSVDTKLLKNVISAGGGQVQTSTTPTARILKGKPKRYVVSCQEDKAIWRPLAQEGFKIYSHELVLRAALRQEIEWERKECVVAG